MIPALGPRPTIITKIMAQIRLGRLLQAEINALEGYVMYWGNRFLEPKRPIGNEIIIPKKVARIAIFMVSNIPIQAVEQVN
tara:strand:+ start:330 stop:572 length:243 start_codon:yes stop_codon:yes gene_type:complete